MYLLIVGVTKLHPDILNRHTLTLVKVNLASRIPGRRPIDVASGVHLVKRGRRILPMLSWRWLHASPRFPRLTVSDTRSMDRNLLVSSSLRVDILILLP